MSLWMVFSIVSTILIGMAVQSLGASSHWHCASYFRNGRNLCNAVLSAVSDSCSSALPIAKHSASSDLVRNGSSRFVLNQVSAPLIATHGSRWESSGASVRSVLIAEQPFDVILTGFAYYAQYASTETWTSTVPAAICPDLAALNDSASILGRFLKNETAVASWLSAIQIHCQQAISLFKSPLSYTELIRQSMSMMHSSRRHRSPQVIAYRSSLPHYKHSPQRRGLDLYPAIRLEAFRIIPDLLNMATALVLSGDRAVSVMTVSSHWNSTQQLAAAKNAKEFWLASKGKCDWCSCMDERKLLQRLSERFSAMEWATMQNTTAVSASSPEGTSWMWRLWSLYGLSWGGLPSSSPTTSTSSSSPSSSLPSAGKERSGKSIFNEQLYAMYAKRLNKDPVLHPLLQAIAAIVQQH